jgi:hypothetical protein
VLLPFFPPKIPSPPRPNSILDDRTPPPRDDAELAAWLREQEELAAWRIKMRDGNWFSNWPRPTGKVGAERIAELEAMGFSDGCILAILRTEIEQWSDERLLDLLD